MLTAPLTGHLDAALTEYAKGFSQNELVGDLIAPRVLVGRQADKYWVYGREFQELTEKTLRATGAPAQRTRFTLSTGSFFARSHALASDIADEDRAGYQPGDLEQDATQMNISKILLDREDALATKLTDTAQVTNNTTLAGINQWSDFGNSDPVKDVETGKAQIALTGVKANRMVVGDPVYRKLKNHPAIIDAFKYTKGGAIGVQQLADFFEVEQFLVAGAVKVVAGTAQFVWGKHAVLAYVSPTPGLKEISAAKTFVWRAAPGTIDGFGVVTGRVPDVTAKADTVGVDWYYDQQITASRVHLPGQERRRLIARLSQVTKHAGGASRPHFENKESAREREEIENEKVSEEHSDRGPDPCGPRDHHAGTDGACRAELCAAGAHQDALRLRRRAVARFGRPADRRRFQTLGRGGERDAPRKSWPLPHPDPLTSAD
jgi:hypothetical protein